MSIFTRRFWEPDPEWFVRQSTGKETEYISPYPQHDYLKRTQDPFSWRNKRSLWDPEVGRSNQFFQFFTAHGFSITLFSQMFLVPRFQRRETHSRSYPRLQIDHPVCYFEILNRGKIQSGIIERLWSERTQLLYSWNWRAFEDRKSICSKTMNDGNFPQFVSNSMLRGEDGDKIFHSGERGSLLKTGRGLQVLFPRLSLYYIWLVTSALPKIFFNPHYRSPRSYLFSYLCRWFRFAQLAKGKKSRP